MRVIKTIQWQCIRCDKVFKEETSLDHHLRDTFCGQYCDVCDKKFSSHEGLESHKKALDHYTIEELRAKLRRANTWNEELLAQLKHAKTMEVESKKLISNEITEMKSTITDLSIAKTKVTKECNRLAVLIELEIQLSDVLMWDIKRNEGTMHCLLKTAIQTLFTHGDINDVFLFELSTIFWRIEVYSDSKTHTTDGQLVRGFLSLDEMLAFRYCLEL